MPAHPVRAAMLAGAVSSTWSWPAARPGISSVL